MTFVTLSFESFVDLQCRLILLPRIEEEGLGAIVANYTPKESPTDPEKSSFHEEKKSDDDHSIKKKETMQEKDAENGNSISSSLDEEEMTKVTPESSKDDKKEASSKNDKTNYDSNETNSSDITGKILIGIEGVENSSDDWLEHDFSQILASIREARYPIVLRLGVDAKEGDVHTKSAENEEHPPLSNGIENHKDGQKPNSTLNAWSSWAATAASNAKEYASAQATALAAARTARLKKETAPPRPPSPSHVKKKCSLFLQLDDGDYVMIPSSMHETLEITTTSILSVRRESSQPCPAKGYRFQWLRSCSKLPCPETSCSSNPKEVDSGSIKNESNSITKPDGSTDQDDEWTILEGATNAIYQPNATDVGHRLKCIVSIEEDSADINCVEDISNARKEETIFCECLSPVSADKQLFNASRQALSRGAQFGNLVGCGSAFGKTFSIQIRIAISSEDKSISSATTIFQCAGADLEPIHASVIKSVSALANPANPKEFEFFFPLGPPEDSSMVPLLSSNGHFKLTAPNRVTRESILFTLGIANYSGEPAGLTENTVLYPHLGECQIATVTSSASSPPQDELPLSNVKFETAQEMSAIHDENRESNVDVNNMEAELKHLRMKLARRDKEVHDLQKRISKDDARCQQMKLELSKCHQERDTHHEESKQSKIALQATEKRIETLEADLTSTKRDYSANISTLENRITAQSEKILELEKGTRSLQNEKAVMTAAVEARDNKLDKMKEMKVAFDELSVKVTKGDSLRFELTDMAKRYEVLCQDLEKVAKSENECKDQLQEAQKSLNELYQNLESETSKRGKCEKELESIRKTSQNLKSERNSFKQKAEGLTKEISRLCRGGRTLRDIEKILADEEARRTEIEVLRSQKKKAVDESQQYRTAYEQQLVAQLNMGVDGAAVKALEQKAELERVVSELTEYVTAKEMQLETMKQVNEALTAELKELAKINMKTNEI
mmetsp:Transcript_2709/g.4024  ORF Transcript_2709/g.4024 Transcript_2709/m.4024 type:complete len:964 (+) Transcript_2709:87-2978(+)